MQAESRLADRYVLVRRLASGGMGEVWLASDDVLGRDVAVKVIGAGTGGDPQAVERFRREATMTAALEHPNIVTIFDSGTHDGAAFIVMELLPGPTLAQLVAERGPLPQLEAVHLGSQIAAGLAAAHRAGVVHRDIKPSNLMFSSSGLLKILDFGIARLSQTTAPGLTTTNAVIGSAPYLSPEQAVGAPADERSDLYSLGCVLTTMVTGQPPFTGEHPMAVLQQHVNSDPPLLRARRPEVSPALEALVAQLLHKRSTERPTSADEVEERLSRLGAGREGAASGATATVLATMLPTTRVLEPGVTRPYPTASKPPKTIASQPQGVRADESTRMRPRSWLLLAAALVVGVVLAAAALTSLLGNNSEGASAPTAPRTPSTPATSTPSSSQKATPQVPTTAAPTSPLAHVRAVVDTVVADGLMDPKKAEEFGHRLDGLAKKHDEGNKGAGKQVDDLTKYLTKLVRSGELTPEGFRRIDAALAGV